MKINDLKTKNNDWAYTVISIFTNGSGATEANFTTKEEAVRYAKTFAEANKGNNFYEAIEVQRLIWNGDEGEYSIFREDGTYDDLIFSEEI